MLWHNCGEMSAEDVEQPLTDLTVIGTSEKSMWQVGDLLGLAKCTNWAVNVPEQTMKSFLSWKDVMHHPP